MRPGPCLGPNLNKPTVQSIFETTGNLTVEWASQGPFVLWPRGVLGGLALWGAAPLEQNLAACRGGRPHLRFLSLTGRFRLIKAKTKKADEANAAKSG